MKYLFYLAIALSLTSCITLIPNEIENERLLGVMPMQYGRASYQVSGKLQADRENIFRQARRWAAFSMTNPSAALAISDNLLGDVIARGTIGSHPVKTKGGYTMVPAVEYAVSIECLDNYYRITLTNFYQNDKTLPHPIEYRTNEVSKKNATAYLKSIDQRVGDLLTDFRVFISRELDSLK